MGRGSPRLHTVAEIESIEARYAQAAPLFPFGHGSSYARIAYSGAELASEQLSAGGELAVRVMLRFVMELREGRKCRC